MTISKTCPHCGAKKTNSGYMKHNGRYTGYECRSWFAEGGQARSKECEIKEVLIKFNLLNIYTQKGNLT